MTDGSGNADFGFAFSQTGKSQTITETLQAGYTLEGFTCDGGNPQAANNGLSLTVNSQDDINCTVTNTPELGSITLNKITTHGVGGPFNLAVTGGAVGVDLHRSATTTQQNTSTATTGDSLAGLYPGAYTIVESSPAGWNLTGIACNDGNGPVDPPDVNGNITLGIGENLTCTYTNDLVATDLEIVKTASGPSPVNGGNDQQIDYTLTVDNNGPGDAHNAATVTDVLPAGASLVSIEPPAGVTCGMSLDQTITCSIPADQLEVSDPAVVIGVTIDVPTNGQTVTNKTIVDSPDDPAPCTVTSDDITCTEETNNYSQVSTDIPNVEPPDDPGTPGTPEPVRCPRPRRPFPRSGRGCAGCAAKSTGIHRLEQQRPVRGDRRVARGGGSLRTGALSAPAQGSRHRVTAVAHAECVGSAPGSPGPIRVHARPPKVVRKAAGTLDCVFERLADLETELEKLESSSPSSTRPATSRPRRPPGGGSRS